MSRSHLGIVGIVLGCAPAPEPADVVACDGVPTAGSPGGFGQDAFPLAWRQEGDLWVADAVRLGIADDTTGLAVTVDGGSARSGFLEVTLDGRVVVDAENGRRFGSAKRSRLAAAAETAETAWPDTADTAWEGPWEDGWGVSPLFHVPTPGGTIVLPLDGTTRPWPGCLLVRPVALDAPDRGRLVVVTKRSPPSANRLEVDLVIAEGVTITEAQLAEATGAMRALLSTAGALELGEVRRWSVSLPEGPYVSQDGADLNELRATELPDAPPWGLRIFLVKDFRRKASLFGIAGGIPGPIGVDGSSAGGVVVSHDTHLDGDGVLLSRTLGETMAHEGGHQLGLFHTTEAEGTTFDVLPDTPECAASRYDLDGDGVVWPEECVDVDGANVMFWTAGSFQQDQVSASQADVLSRSPIAIGEEEP